MTEATVISTISPVRDWKGRLRLPPKGRSLPQDAEWCEIEESGAWRRLRFHDYGELYERPGLYDYLFYDLLECQSPRRVVGLLAEVRADLATREPLRVIDLGAGNGLVGKELKRVGAAEIVGLDILDEARAAAQRDLPGVYASYLVDDMTQPSAQTDARLRALRPNALTCVAALGFGDIPPAAFRTAFNAIGTPGWLALTIKEDFLDVEDGSGFSRLLHEMMAGGILHEQARLRIRHRVSVAGEPLFYVGLVARKLEDIPEGLVQ